MLEMAYVGPCRADCNCTTEEATVCAMDFSGTEYTNSCFADCAGVEWREGSCDSLQSYDCEANCPGDYDPEVEVCGTDGVTYKNGCLVHCTKAEPAYNGKCASGKQCDCAEGGGAPVCGLDGVTYCECVPRALRTRGDRV
jgi:Kazal-type serine protease inhibitor domain